MTAGSFRRGGAGIVRAIRGARRAVAFYGSATLVARKALRVFRNEGWRGLWRRAAVLADAAGHAPAGGTAGALPACAVPPDDTAFAPRVSVIVPNYNHASYLRQRLDSIYGQEYDNFEVILLDDCSTDGSREILLEYATRHADRTRTFFNEANSGGVFNQWNKGLELARGELVWIAESDDYCDANFLRELVRFFRNEAVTLAFSRTEFVESGGQTIWTTAEHLADCLADLVGQPFIRSAHWLVNQAWARKNVVPNASSAVFRHPGAMPLLSDAGWKSLRLCGDWIFYLHLVRGGLVGYSPGTTNYYRQHDAGTSHNVRKAETYYREAEVVASTLLRLYKLQPDILQSQRDRLYGEWCTRNGFDAQAEFDRLYSLSRARATAGERSPNLLMVGFALIAGGGETFPINLANALKRRGHAVSFLNLRHAPTEPGVRRMLDPAVPLFELEHLGAIGALCDHLGIEIAHSHHAWADMVLADCLARHPQTRQLVTMHGMYESMSGDALADLLPRMDRALDRIVYTAEKNLKPFSPDFQARKRFVRIDNALPRREMRAVDRGSLGIAADDFVCCLVSRAIPEKGWEEAIRAVRAAQASCGRTIHLVLIGEGEEFQRLRPMFECETIHFLGFRANVRDYFAMSDLGLLPSRFEGESAPLVLIDCLWAGRPMVASAIGEIPGMLQGRSGLAGAVFGLVDRAVPIETLAQLISHLAVDERAYRRMIEEVPHAVRKFDPDVMVQKYEDVYDSLAVGNSGRSPCEKLA